MPDVDEMTSSVSEVAEKIEGMAGEKLDKVEQTANQMIDQGSRVAMGAMDRMGAANKKMGGMLEDFLVGESGESKSIESDNSNMESGAEAEPEEVNNQEYVDSGYAQENYDSSYAQSSEVGGEGGGEDVQGGPEPVAEYEGQKIYRQQDSKGDVFYASEDGKTTYIPNEGGGGQVYHSGEKVTNVSPAEEQEAMAYAQEKQE